MNWNNGQYVPEIWPTVATVVIVDNLSDLRGTEKTRVRKILNEDTRFNFEEYDANRFPFKEGAKIVSYSSEVLRDRPLVLPAWGLGKGFRDLEDLIDNFDETRSIFELRSQTYFDNDDLDFENANAIVHSIFTYVKAHARTSSVSIRFACSLAAQRVYEYVRHRMGRFQRQDEEYVIFDDRRDVDREIYSLYEQSGFSIPAGIVREIRERPDFMDLVTTAEQRDDRAMEEQRKLADAAEIRMMKPKGGVRKRTSPSVKSNNVTVNLHHNGRKFSGEFSHTTPFQKMFTEMIVVPIPSDPFNVFADGVPVHQFYTPEKHGMSGNITIEIELRVEENDYEWWNRKLEPTEELPRDAVIEEAYSRWPGVKRIPGNGDCVFAALKELDTTPDYRRFWTPGDYREHIMYMIGELKEKEDATLDLLVQGLFTQRDNSVSSYDETLNKHMKGLWRGDFGTNIDIEIGARMIGKKITVYQFQQGNFSIAFIANERGNDEGNLLYWSRGYGDQPNHYDVYEP
tara:strand:+ start:5327 stop:6865 length:1539 start_codon:yes stop_codon:yes gene_type:complete